MAHDLYDAIVRSVLPRLNRPVTPAQILTYLKDAGVDDTAKASGLATWLHAQPARLLSRSSLMSRLLREPEFRASIADAAEDDGNLGVAMFAKATIEKESSC